MVTAFVDMVGLLMVIPLLPFYAVRMGGGGLVVGVLVSAYAVAQLLSAPLWGRVSDRFGRRPALLVGLGASAIAYVIFAYADSLWILLLSRLVQGAGGGTVGVIQAYVADATEPENRARSLGWLSAATNVGVTIGPVIGSLSMGISEHAPGLIAAGLCVANMGFAWFYLQESHDVAGARASTARPVRPREVVWRVLAHPGEPAPRMIWIYSIGMGAFQMMTALLALFLATRFGVTEKTIGAVYAYNGAISVLARAVVLGRAVDRLGEARLSRVGQVLLASGLAILPLTWRIGGAATLDLSALPGGWGVVEVPFRTLALMGALALVPLGTAFTFPCVTSILSRVIPPFERGVYMGVQQSYGGAARVLAPLWAGWAFDHLGVGVPFWTGAVLVLATLGMGFGIEEYTRPKPAPGSAPAAAG
jgi:multidrug resistance protein